MNCVSKKADDAYRVMIYNNCEQMPRIKMQEDFGDDGNHV